MNFKILTFYLFIIISISTLFLKYDGIREVLAQAQAPTSANVTIRGWLGSIVVNCTPVSFSQGATVLSDGDIYPKVEDCNRPDITVELDASTNVAWNFYINATDLVDNKGHVIPVSQIQINTSCNGDRTLPYNPITLGYSLRTICGPTETVESPINAHEYVNVTFYLTVPVGTYNNTYLANFTIYANSTGADNNQTWIGVNKINVTISKTYEIAWTLAPISFGTLSPRLEPYNATSYLGFPSNITVGPRTNIFVDLYINGTDLVATGNPLNIIDSGNVTYSNATGGATKGSDNPTDWPNSTKALNNNLPPSSTNGDFWNWGMIPNRTHVYNYWNMTVQFGTLPGTYVSNITAKVVDAGNNP